MVDYRTTNINKKKRLLYLNYALSLKRIKKHYFFVAFKKIEIAIK